MAAPTTVQAVASMSICYRGNEGSRDVERRPAHPRADPSSSGSSGASSAPFSVHTA